MKLGVGRSSDLGFVEPVELYDIAPRHCLDLVIGYALHDALDDLPRVGPNRIMMGVVIAPEHAIDPDPVAGQDPDFVILECDMEVAPEVLRRLVFHVRRELVWDAVGGMIESV